MSDDKYSFEGDGWKVSGNIAFSVKNGEVIGFTVNLDKCNLAMCTTMSVKVQGVVVDDLGSLDGSFERYGTTLCEIGSNGKVSQMTLINPDDYDSNMATCNITAIKNSSID